MRHGRLFLVMVMVTVTATACGAQLSQAGKNVRTVKGRVPVGCVELGAVEGVDTHVNAIAMRVPVDRDQAVILLRNSAGKMNANVVRIDAETEGGEVEGNAVRRRYVILGVAFRCP